MNRLFKGLFLIILVICSLISCSQPIGSLGHIESDNGRGGGNAVDGFFIDVFKNNYYLTRPQEERILRRRGDYFRVVGLGSIGRIDPNDPELKIEIFSAPISVNLDIHAVIQPDGYFEFAIEGNYILKGTYKDMTDEVPIEVFGSEPNTGEGSSGLGWIWLP